MIKQDFHIHTKYCDGNNSPEEMIEAALAMEMSKLGFSCHSYTHFNEEYCIKKEDISVYKEEINGLAKKYKNNIEILCGVEQDFYSIESTKGFDYIIGSVHSLKINGGYYEIDCSKEEFVNIAKKFYDDDYISLCQDYFGLVADVVEKTNADIIGHFDLVTKYNENNVLFDTSDKNYINAAKKAIDKLLKTRKPFEVNTGAISRGYRTKAYPEITFLKYIKEKGGSVVLSSDSHSINGICNCFDEYEKILLDFGFKLSKAKFNTGTEFDVFI